MRTARQAVLWPVPFWLVGLWGGGKEEESSETFSLISITKLPEHSSESWEAFAFT